MASGCWHEEPKPRPMTAKKMKLREPFRLDQASFPHDENQKEETDHALRQESAHVGTLGPQIDRRLPCRAWPDGTVGYSHRMGPGWVGRDHAVERLRRLLPDVRAGRPQTASRARIASRSHDGCAT